VRLTGLLTTDVYRLCFGVCLGIAMRTSVRRRLLCRYLKALYWVSAECRDYSAPSSWLVYTISMHLRSWCQWLHNYLTPPPLRAFEISVGFMTAQARCVCLHLPRS